MKKKLIILLSLAWKAGLALLGLAALVIGILIVAEWHEDNYGRSRWRDMTLSDGVDVHYFADQRVRVWNNRTGKYVTQKLRWVSCTPERDSLTVYCDKNGNRGYINCNTGEIVIRADRVRLSHAWHFSEGAAFVVLPGEDSLSVMDHGGRVVARNVAPYDDRYDYVFENGLCEMHVGEMTGLLAIDGDGSVSWAIPADYYYIQYPNTFGYRIARNEEGCWLFDADLKLVFPEPYDKLEYAVGRSEGTGTLYRSHNHRKELVEYDGTVVEPFVIDGTYSLRYMVKYNEDDEDEYALDPDLVVYRVDDWEGLMNKHTGRLVTPADFTDFEMVSKDLIKADLSYRACGNAVVMDRNGRVVNH